MTPSAAARLSAPKIMRLKYATFLVPPISDPPTNATECIYYFYYYYYTYMYNLIETVTYCDGDDVLPSLKNIILL